VSLKARYKDSGSKGVSTRVSCRLLPLPIKSKTVLHPNHLPCPVKKQQATCRRRIDLRIAQRTRICTPLPGRIGGTRVRLHDSKDFIRCTQLPTLRLNTARSHILKGTVTCKRQARETHQNTCLTPNPTNMSPIRSERRSADGALSKASDTL
jgi:hypothetical protein